MSAGPIPPAALAAAVAEARALLRMAGEGEQAVLERLVATAFQLGEAFTGILFVRRDVTELLPAQPAWRVLAAAPVAAITGVSGVSADGAAFALPAESHAVDIDGDGCGWVKVTAPGTARRVAVSYAAGLAAEWAELPAPIAQGVVALAAHLFNDGGSGRQPPASVAALWRPYRRMRLVNGARA